MIRMSLSQKHSTTYGLNYALEIG